MRADIHFEAAGKWRSVLLALGVDPSALTGKHGPCPLCGGRDRWRFDDSEGRGTWFCNACGAGNGIDLVMRVKAVDFREAVRMVRAELPTAEAKPVRQRDVIDPTPYIVEWRNGSVLSGDDSASRYLTSRGLPFDRNAHQLRLIRASYRHSHKSVARHAEMVALFVSPDRSRFTTHTTYLTDDGRKAALPVVRKLAPLPVPSGGAVRLAPSDEIMGIAEGIETALAAAELFRIPVWAALNACNLAKWQPPEAARQVIICADNDANLTGQKAANDLQNRLSASGLQAEVRVPNQVGTDWNDVLLGQEAEGAAAWEDAV